MSDDAEELEDAVEVRTVVGFFRGATVWHAAHGPYPTKHGGTAHWSLCVSAGGSDDALVNHAVVISDVRTRLCKHCERMLAEGQTRDALGTECRVTIDPSVRLPPIIGPIRAERDKLERDETRGRKG